MKRPNFRRYRFVRILSIWYGTVHKTSCLMRCNGGNGRQDTPVLSEYSTYMIQSHKLLYLGCEFDQCCIHYFVWNSLVALLEALCAQMYIWVLDFLEFLPESNRRSRDSQLWPTKLVLHCLAWKNTDFGCRCCHQESYNHSFNTPMAPLRINFCPRPAPAGRLRQFGTDLNGVSEEHGKKCPCQLGAVVESVECKEGKG